MLSWLISPPMTLKKFCSDPSSKCSSTPSMCMRLSLCSWSVGVPMRLLMPVGSSRFIFSPQIHTSKSVCQCTGPLVADRWLM